MKYGIDWTPKKISETEATIRRLGDITKAAAEIGISPRTLREAFQRHAGYPPSRALLGSAVPETEPTPPRVEGSLRKILVCPDVHVPYHDRSAWNLFLQVATEIRPDVLVVIGDFVDCYAVSRFDRDPERGRFLKDELDEGRAAIDQVDALQIPRVVYCEGNHETRLPRLLSKIPELHGLVSVEDYLGIKARGWEWVPYRQHTTIGKMGFTHDVGRSGVYAGRWTLSDYGGNICFGHTHRLGLTFEGSVKEGARVCLNVGWLGDVEKVDYAHRVKAHRESQHGFGLVYQDQDGISHAHAVPIVCGACEVEGRRISV